MSEVKKVVLVTVASQVGKATMLKMIADQSRKYISLDDLNIRKLAQDDPKLFMMNYKPPIIIDEIQYAPQLLSYIKLHVDLQKKEGLLAYWFSKISSYEGCK